jgi:2-polyprenyl-6-hydroxyphenyl methylase / 3-demethylubiquinone-9 3-methyltransferase
VVVLALAFAFTGAHIHNSAVFHKYEHPVNPNSEQNNSAANPAISVDPAEISRFSALSDRWWAEDGEFSALHKLNPVRLAYIRDRALVHFGGEVNSLKALDGLRVLDLGCGGGLLSEPLHRMGAELVSIDASEDGIRAAREHAGANGMKMDYRCTTAEELAAAGEKFDIVVAMEIIEHVASVDDFLDTCSALVKPGGLFFAATLNRTPKSYALAIAAAEYILRWVPRGTHDWRKFVRPSELARGLRRNGLATDDVSGVTLDIASGEWRKSEDTGVNYMLSAQRPV